MYFVLFYLKINDGSQNCRNKNIIQVILISLSKKMNFKFSVCFKNPDFHEP